MSDDKTANEESKPMFPEGWHIDRKPTIEMRIKGFVRKLIKRG